MTQVNRFFKKLFSNTATPHPNVQAEPGFPLDAGENIYDEHKEEELARLKKQLQDQRDAANHSTEVMSLLSKATNDVLWDWDMRSNKIWWNDNFYLHFGFEKNPTATDIAFRNNHINPKDKGSVIGSINEAIAARKEEWSAEYSFIKADGTPALILDRGYIKYDQDGKAYRMAGAMMDVTESKKAEEEIKRNENHFRETLDKLLEGIQIIGFDWRYIYVNESMTKHGKYSKEELIGHTVMEKYPGIEQTDIFKVYKRCFEERISIQLENEFLFPDNTMGWFELSFQPVPEGIFILSVDITDRKKAEQSLLRSEARFRRIFESNMLGIMFWDAKGEIVEANDRFLEMIGYTRNDLSEGKISWKSMTPPEYAQLDLKALEQIELTGICQSIEKEYIRKDGSKIPIIIGAASIDGDSPEKGVSYVVDITDRRKAEERIQILNKEISKSEHRFRTLLESSNDIIAIADEKFKTVYRSPSSGRITGWTPGEREEGGGLEQTHPDDMPALQNVIHDMLKAPRQPLPVSFRTKHRNGHYIWLEGVITNLLQEDAVRGIVTNLADVTERKLAEENLIRSEKIYRTIASSIPGSVICLLDTEYRYLLIEGDMLDKLGYSKEKLLGNKVKDVMPAESYARSLVSLQRVFKGEIFTTEGTGPGYDIVSRYVPLKDENNKVFAAMVVLFDVSELKRAQLDIANMNTMLEQKIVERTRQLEEANKELESFSYSVSHDLRAPLRAISGYASILIEDYAGILDAEGKRIANMIVSNAKRMGQLIDDLLNFSRIGRAEASPSYVNMQLMVESTISELLPAESRKKYEIKVHQLPGVEADPAMIKQAWVNFIENAVKYSSKKESPEIEIGSIDDATQNVYFIKDNGAGFDMQYAHKLFGVFQRLHSHAEFTGTGVGLALVNRIIQKHNGKVWVEAVEDGGATFYFSLPKKMNNESTE